MNEAHIAEQYSRNTAIPAASEWAGVPLLNMLRRELSNNYLSKWLLMSGISRLLYSLASNTKAKPLQNP